MQKSASSSYPQGRCSGFAHARGWVNYFRVGNSRTAFGKIKYEVERKVRRLAAKKCKREGFGWKRWSSTVVYGTWGLFRDYRVVYWSAKACPN
jgi:RNA-directed DNA polymerase